MKGPWSDWTEVDGYTVRPGVLEIDGRVFDSGSLQEVEVEAVEDFEDLV